MTELDLIKLKPGEIIRNKGSGQTYIVIEDFVAIRVVQLSNPSEWEKIDAKGDSVKPSAKRRKSPTSD